MIASAPLDQAWSYPLFEASYRRRSRRFGLGFEMQEGLARVAMHAFIRVATEIARDGKFDSFAGLISNPELNKFFNDDRKRDASP